MSDRLPYMRLYPGDELQAPVSFCSLAAQGLWLRLRIIMHSCEPYGYLCPGAKPLQLSSKTSAGQERDSSGTSAGQAAAVLAGQTRDIGRTCPNDVLIARMCGVSVDEYRTLVSELDDAGVTHYTVNRIMYCEELTAQASEREQWTYRKRRQRELPFNGERTVTPMSRRSHANVPPDVTPSSSSSSSSYIRGKKAANGSKSKAQRIEEANERVRDEILAGKHD